MSVELFNIQKTFYWKHTRRLKHVVDFVLLMRYGVLFWLSDDHHHWLVYIVVMVSRPRDFVFVVFYNYWWQCHKTLNCEDQNFTVVEILQILVELFYEHVVVDERFRCCDEKRIRSQFHLPFTQALIYYWWKLFKIPWPWERFHCIGGDFDFMEKFYGTFSGR